MPLGLDLIESVMTSNLASAKISDLASGSSCSACVRRYADASSDGRRVQPTNFGTFTRQGCDVIATSEHGSVRRIREPLACVA